VRRERNRVGYERRYGSLPAVDSKIAVETDERVEERYARIRTGLSRVTRELAAFDPQVLIFVGDDQNENLRTVLPQLAIYTGDAFSAGTLNATVPKRVAEPDLARALVEECVAGDIDVAPITEFPDGRLFAHAFGPVLDVIDPLAKIPVVPVFVNSIHLPAPSPRRCFMFGRSLRRALDRSEFSRIAVFGSGGLSHFTAGFPWSQYRGTFGYGDIDVEFDRWLFERLRAADVNAIAGLSTDDLTNHGEIELRSWIVTLGILGSRRPEFLIYEPFFRAIMGMGVACWPSRSDITFELEK
jgi:hypothetical protein